MHAQLSVKPSGTGKATANALHLNYDTKMHNPLIKKFYGGSDFFNFGYWRPDTRTAQTACENLMEELLGLIPNKKGAILDVACGLGATTRHLKRYYDESRTVGVNISPQQIQTCRSNAPGCNFGVMDAVSLGFKNQSFDAVICVEAAFHFKTREAFLREAHRVLRPGGHLVMSDMMLDARCEARSPVFFLENHVNSADGFSHRLEKTGFTQIVVRDVLEQTWIQYILHLIRFLRDKLARHEVSADVVNQFMFTLRHYRIPAVRGYFLVGAQKRS